MLIDIGFLFSDKWILSRLDFQKVNVEWIFTPYRIKHKIIEHFYQLKMKYLVYISLWTAPIIEAIRATLYTNQLPALISSCWLGGIRTHVLPFMNRFIAPLSIFFWFLTKFNFIRPITYSETSLTWLWWFGFNL